MNTTTTPASPAIQAILAKILRGEPLTPTEQIAWSNRWCNDYPVRS